MRAATQERLASMKRFAWFSKLGEKDLPKTSFIPSWSEAVAAFDEESWMELKLDLSNRLTGRLAATNMERFREWNHLHNEIHLLTLQLITEASTSLRQQGPVSDAMTNEIHSDLTMALLEVEYSDLVQPFFYYSLAGYYARGHLPCGWDGNFPNGRMLAF